MQWTSAKPNVPGWYWYRQTPKEDPAVCQVVLDLETHVLMVTWETVEAWPVERYYGDQWAGPLELPR